MLLLWEADGAEARGWPVAAKTFLTHCVFSLLGQGGVVIVLLPKAFVTEDETKNKKMLKSFIYPARSSPSALQKTSAVTVTTSALLTAASAAAPH